MNEILILNGPNLNLLGKREKEHYDVLSLEDISSFTQQSIAQKYTQVKLTWRQSNHEGELVEWIQKAENYDAIIINPGGYSHSSVAILDALKLFNGIVVEVHLSKVGLREEFRLRRVTAQAADMTIEGAGKFAYLLGIEYIQELQN